MAQLKVIGAGLPRTATTTQLIALEMLGFKPYHMRDMLDNIGRDTPLWADAREGRADWDALLGEADATVDWPGAYHWRELMDVYPDAKVLLSVRDGEGFARSMFDTIWSIYFGDSSMHHLSRARYHVDPEWRAWIDLMTAMCWEHDGPFAGAHTQREDMIAAMERWNDEVKSTVPAERLLVWNPKDGWEPLCEFLDVPVPAEELPNVNDTAAFKRGIHAACIGAINAWWDKQEDGPGLHGR